MCKRLNFIIAITIFLLGMLFTTALSTEVNEKEAFHEYEILDHDILHFKQSLDVSVRYTLNVLNGLKGLFIASEYVEPQEWVNYTENLSFLEYFPEIQGLTYVEYIEKNELNDFVDKYEEENDQTITIYPEGEREDYYVAKYIAPLRDNKEVIGFDLGSNSIRRNAIEKARDTGRPTITRPVKLIQKARDRGFIIFVPVYDPSKPIDTLEQRREAFNAVIAGGFISDNFMYEIEKFAGRDSLSVKIFDVTSGIDFLYEYNATSFRGGKCSIAEVNKDFTVLDNIWSVRLSKEKCEYFWLKNNFYILITGGFLSLFLSLFVFWFLCSRFKAESIAQKMTAHIEERKKSLEDLNRKLALEVKEKRKTERALERQISEAEKMNQLMVGREMKIIELKDELKTLKKSKK